MLKTASLNDLFKIKYTIGVSPKIDTRTSIKRSVTMHENPTNMPHNNNKLRNLENLHERINQCRNKEFYTDTKSLDC